MVGEELPLEAEREHLVPRKLDHAGAPTSNAAAARVRTSSAGVVTNVASSFRSGAL